MRHATRTGVSYYIHYNIIFVIAFLLLPLFSLVTIAGDTLAFPGAMGWGAETRGAWGHPTIDPVILKVTNLSRHSDEEGSFFWALSQNYPRIIVFEVGGVIDAESHPHTNSGNFSFYNPYVTVAGQTAPSPGITIIRGGLWIRTHDVIIQHIRILPDGANTSPRQRGIIINYKYDFPEAHSIMIDHVSISWGSAGLFQVDGEVEAHLSHAHDVTLQNSLIAEAVQSENAGWGTGGSTQVRTVNNTVIRNLFSNWHRSLSMSASHGAYINNYIAGWGLHAAYNNMLPDLPEDLSFVWTFVGNHARRSDEGSGRQAYHAHRGLSSLYSEDNVSFDYDGVTPVNYFSIGTGADIDFLDAPPYWHSTFDGNVMPSGDVFDYVVVNAGSRPWDRHPIDERIIDGIVNGVYYRPTVNNFGREPFVFPDDETTYREFNPDEWDLQYMIPHAGYWNAPEPISPENNTVGIGQNITFQWDAEDLLTHFTLQIATDEGFSSIVVNLTNITDRSYAVNHLHDGTNYYWRVRGYNATGPSQWSEVWQFNTDGEDQQIPDIPNLISPEDSSVSTSESILLEWSLVDKAESYTAQVSTQSDFSSIIAEADGISATTFEVENLDIPQTYYWRVRANNSLSGHSGWSEIWKFSAVLEADQESFSVDLFSGWNQISSYILPDKPAIKDVFADLEGNVVIVRNDNAGVYWPEIGINEISEWDPLQGYQVYVYDNDLLVFNGTILSPESTPIHLREGWNQIAYLHRSIMNVEEVLAPLGEKVEIVLNNTGEVYWPEYDINTMEIMVPGQGYKINVTDDVTFTYPANSENPGTKIVADGSLSNRLVNHTHQPIYYKVDFPNTGDFAILLLISTSFNNGDEIGVWTTSNELVGSGVALNGRVLVTVWGRNPLLINDLKAPGAVNGEILRITRWSVDENTQYPVSVSRLRDITGWQLPDAVFRFEVEGVWIAEIDNLSQVPQRYTLEQNFPNPFNPATTIRYSIPETVHVRLEIYDILGQRIQTIVDEVQQAGYHQAVFNADHLASSVYFYRLHAGNYINMKRFVLMR
jgi:hypothetical protein